MSDKTLPRTRNRAIFALEEIGGDQFATLADAQRAALPVLANDIASTLRAMLAAGVLAVCDGRVVVAAHERDN